MEGFQKREAKARFSTIYHLTQLEISAVTYRLFGPNVFMFLALFTKSDKMQEKN